MTTKRCSIAVIGSGVAGLTAAHQLAKHDSVTLYEADNRLGGHAHTHQLFDAAGQKFAVDSAFLVHNDRTYPTLCGLFDELGVQTQGTDMSMSVRCDGMGLEYAGARGVRGLFPSPTNLARPRYLRMLGEVKRFHRLATDLLHDGSDEGAETVAAFLYRHRFSDFFARYFMTPLVAAVWSCPPAAALDYPARYLFTFLEHHGMLTVFGSPVWRTVVGGSANYVRAIATGVQEVFTSTPVRAVRRTDSGVQVQLDGYRREFDAVVIATHSDQALALLAEPSDRQRAVLGAIPYSTNHAQLHTDTSVLPRHSWARASWNYLLAPDHDDVVVTYDVTRLMRLPTSTRFLVTLGGRDYVNPDAVVAEMTYQHPLYTTESLAAQHLLPEIEDGRIVFAGAYHGWGFHEDGAAAGMRAAYRLRHGRDRVAALGARL